MFRNAETFPITAIRITQPADRFRVADDALELSHPDIDVEIAATRLACRLNRPANEIARISTLDARSGMGNFTPMSSVKEIESALTALSLQDLQAVRDWLDDLIEDQLEVSDEFKTKVQRAKQAIAAGVHSRVRNPPAGQ